MKSKNKNIIYSNILDNEKSAFVINEQKFSSNIESMLSSFKAFYPNVIIGYSYKTNYVPLICKIAHDLGCFAEVVSEMEVDMAQNVLTNKSNIIYNGPVKSIESLRIVIKNGGIINIDNSFDLEMIDLILKEESNLNLKAKVALRLNFSFNENDSRFGMDEDNIIRIKEEIKCKDNIELIGFHLHLPFRSMESFDFRVKTMIKVLEKNKDVDLKYINIGGGFFGDISIETAKSLGINKPPSYNDYAKLIGDQLSDYFSKNNYNEWPTLFIEPGSSVVADVLDFITRIHTVKQIDNRDYIVTYAGRHLLSPTNKTVEMPVSISFFNEKIICDSETVNYVVAGYTCIEGDIIGRLNSTKIIDRENSYIIVSNVGSYSIVMGSDFILPQPAIYSFGNDGLRMLRQSKKTIDIINSFI
ncbi:hypothetical protein E0I26_15880 [Flavobacterium rhamnosiphilum]|uniref:Orn/DAP/Arg decarboxylase 2 N-terminal domain-containing protein n=1 Tax=Flavobacterium rhamnosiphilum TaxID=2541724 RepID=A0A4R5F2N4_9FLAO|nr:hypothetical protein [Flavobacterium rhamnosiphilum]TDE41738.1 hypothetical protein E0I26_15880 [Flavobacterium rhamnosiphilum]